MRNTVRLVSAAACAAVLAAPLAVRAERVDPEAARGLARRVAGSAMGRTAAADVRLAFAAIERRAAPTADGLKRSAADAADTLFYVFELGGAGGFVIVSADDAAKPVLGYSYGGRYDPQNLPPNMAAWLDGLRRQILLAKRQGLEPDGSLRREWSRYLGEAAISPLSAAASPLLETEWDQYEPYNLLCPTVEGARAAAGCAITAWAQVMKYHNHPARGTGRSEAYVTNTYKINIPSVSFETDYRWNDMRDVYPEEDESNSPQNTAVATLMYHLGVSVKTDYLPEGSIADGLAEALTEHFGYDKGMRRVDRERYQRVYGKAAWEALLKGQLDDRRPVLYGASDPRAGHEFVVDGYDNSGKFHINWGWGGRYNGYYEIDALVGVSADMYDFSSVRYQYAYVDIKPNAGGAAVTHNPNFALAEFAASKTELAPADPFTVTARVTCDTAAYIDAARQMLIGAALTDGRDSIVAVTGQARANIYPWKSDTATTVSCALPDAVAAGAYTLKIAVSEYDYNSATREYIPRGWKIVALAAPGVQSGIAVSVNQAPVITAQPSDQKAAAGATATFSVAAKPNGTAAVTGYQWQVEIADTILAENFEGGAGGYTVVNGAQPNKWSVGNAAAGLSGKAAYISNDGGASNAYSASSAGAAHIYMDIAFPASPAGQPFTLAFDWKGMGKDRPLDCYSTDDGVVCVGFGGGVDYLQVTLAEPGAAPQVGAAVEGLDLGIYYNSNTWKKALYLIPASNAGKTKRLVFTWHNEATDGAANPPIAIDNITVTVNPRFADVKDGSGGTTASYTTPAATPEMHGARYRCVVTNALGNSTASEPAELSVEEMGNAVLAAERAVPAPFAKAEASVSPPPALSTGLTVGPNPAGASRAAPVRFFRQGARIESAELSVYDASGKAVRKIALNDGGVGARRPVGSWDLTDDRGRRVPEGAYLVKGAVKARGGRREPVSAVVSVR